MTETTKTPVNIELVASVVLGDDLNGVAINAVVTKDRLKLSTKNGSLSMDLKIDQSPVYYLKDSKEEVLPEGNWTLTFNPEGVNVVETPKVEKPKVDKTATGLRAGCSSNPRFTKEY